MYLLPQIPGPGRSSDDDFLNPRIIQADFFRGYPFSKGAIGACGLSIAACPSLPAISGPSSEDALVTLGRISLLCCAAAPNPDAPRGLWSSTYLLPQIPGPACLNPPNPLFKGAHQASVRTRAHATASLFFGRHLMMPYLIPHPPFQGGDQGLRVFHHRWDFPARQLRPGI